MGQFKVQKSSYKTPPEDSYWLDLVWIEHVTEGKFGENYRWHWIIADIEAQKEYNMCRASAQTSVTATTKNRFGQFIQALSGKADIENLEASTESLVLAKFRVKAFIAHTKKIYDGDEVIFCNIEKLIEGTAKKGEGIGVKGAPEKLKPAINEFLKSQGLPLLEIKPEEDRPNRSVSATQPTVAPAVAPKREDLPW